MSDLGDFDPMREDYQSTFNSYNFQNGNLQLGMQNKQNFVPRLHILNIPNYINDKQFCEIFSKCGTIKHSSLHTKNQATSKAGKILYTTVEATNNAIKMYHNQEPYNMSVCVDKYYTPVSQNKNRQYINNWQQPATRFGSGDNTFRRPPLLPNVNVPSGKVNGQFNMNHPGREREKIRQPIHGSTTCLVCNEKSTLNCKCRCARYCSSNCQKKDWKRHKEECSANLTSPQQSASSASSSSLQGASNHYWSGFNGGGYEAEVCKKTDSTCGPYSAFPLKQVGIVDNNYNGEGSNRSSRPSEKDEAFRMRRSKSCFDKRSPTRSQSRDLAANSEVKSPKKLVDKPCLPLKNSNYQSMRRLQHENFKPVWNDVASVAKVVFIEHPHSFYIRLSAEDKILPYLEDVCSVQNDCAVFKKNDVIAARYSDGLWYRVKVLNLNRYGSYEVLFIDYGNVGFFEQRDLCSIPQELAELPAQALHCRLENLCPRTGTEWTEEDINRFSDLVEEEILSVKKVKVTDGVYSVLLTNKTKADIGSLLNELNCEKLQTPISCGIINDWHCGTNVLAFITYCVAPGQFWVLDKTNSDLSKLQSLGKFCSEVVPCKSHLFEVGSIVAAREASEERLWYRAFILDKVNTGWLVQYLDFGNLEIVTELCPLPEDFKVLPALAVSLNAVSTVDKENDRDLEVGRSLTLKLLGQLNEFMMVSFTDEENHLYLASSVWFDIKRFMARKLKVNNNRIVSSNGETVDHNLKEVKRCDETATTSKVMKRCEGTATTSNVKKRCDGTATASEIKKRCDESATTSEIKKRCGTSETTSEIKKPCDASVITSEIKKQCDILAATSESKRNDETATTSEIKKRCDASENTSEIKKGCDISTVTSVVIPSSSVKNSTSNDEPKLQVKKSLNFELPPLILKEGETLPIFPIVCNDEGIYVQILTDENASIFENVFLDLGSDCDADKYFVEPPPASTICCGKSNIEDAWYRCMVLNTLSMDTVEVRYVDYGNREMLTLDRMCELPNKYWHYAPCAVHILPSDVDNTVTDKINELLMESSLNWNMQIVNAKSQPVEVVISTSEGTLLKDLLGKTPNNDTVQSELNTETLICKIDETVDICDAASSNQSESPLKSNRDHFKSSGLSPSVNDNPGKADECEKNMSYETTDIVKLPVGKTVEVIFTTVGSPHYMFCWYSDSNVSEIACQLDELTERIGNAVENEDSGPHFPKKQDLCIAKFASYNQWYRAVCLSDSRQTCLVMAVDYGDNEHVECKNIRRMRKEFMDLKLQGVHCALINFSEDMTFGSDICEQFREMVPQYSVCKIEVISCDPRGYYKIRIPSIDGALRAFNK